MNNIYRSVILSALLFFLLIFVSYILMMGDGDAELESLAKQISPKYEGRGDNMEKITIPVDEVSKPETYKSNALEEEKEDFEIPSNQPYFFPKRRFVPKINYKKSNKRFGYYFGNVNEKTGQYLTRPLPVDEEDFDCKEYNKEHLELFQKMEVIVDIEKRKEQYNLTKPELKYLTDWNKHVMHPFDELYKYACELHHIRKNRRKKVKTEVKWTEGEKVVIFLQKKFPGWKSFNDIKYKNCSVPYVITRDEKDEKKAHVQMYNWPDTRIKDEKAKKDDYGTTIKNHYKVFECLESTSQLHEVLYYLTMKHYDFTMSFMPWSDIPLYYDWDRYYYTSQLPTDYYIDSYKKDMEKSPDQMKKETIEHINKNHMKGKPIAVHISHCNDLYHKEKGSAIGHLRTLLMNYLHKNGLTVVNYGSCKNFGTKGRSKYSGSKKYKRNHIKLLEQNLHPFNLAVENKILETYSTEKIFQASFAKYSIPIYLGDPFVEHRFPSKILREKGYKWYIDAKDFDTPQHLVTYLDYLLKNQTAYLEYFQWRFDKVFLWERSVHETLHDYFDDEGANTVPYCRVAERFVAERLKFYPELSKKENKSSIEEKDDEE